MSIYQAKPYDAKKSVWVPNSNKTEGGYLEGLLESKDGKKATVMVGKEKKVFKEDEVCQMNPPVYDCAADMADLTYLGDACVLWNSVVRYKNQLIYTYSGLFCIAINPYKRFPIVSKFFNLLDMTKHAFSVHAAYHGVVCGKT